MKAEKRLVARGPNSLGEFEEASELREVFDREWKRLSHKLNEETSADSPTSSPPDELDRLLSYYLALDQALSGVSTLTLSRLLRTEVQPPKAFLPFIARAYELEPEGGPKKRGPKVRVTHGYRFYLYLLVIQVMGEQKCSIQKAVSKVRERLLEDGTSPSEQVIRDAFTDFREVDSKHSSRSA